VPAQGSDDKRGGVLSGICSFAFSATGKHVTAPQICPTSNTYYK